VALEKEKDALVRWVIFTNESLSKIDDIELATLKIHLVLQDALKYLLASRLGVDGDAFFDLQCDFPVLAKIALAGTDNRHLLGALLALNTARNHMSHRIGSPNFTERLEVFVREIGHMQEKPTEWPRELPEQLSLLKDAFGGAAYAIFDVAINRYKKDD